MSSIRPNCFVTSEKNLAVFAFIVIILLAFTGCSAEGNYNYEQEIIVGRPNTRPPSVMINGTLFTVSNTINPADYGITENTDYDGRITSEVRISELPTEDDQTNISTMLYAPYFFYNDYVIIFWNHRWTLFIPVNVFP